MARTRGVTWAQVVAAAVAFPGVVEKSSYGTPGLYVGKHFLSRLREPGVIVLTPIEDDEQRFLMETSPDAFFLTDHYRGYPTILVRLARVQRTQLAELVEQCWRRLATRKLLAEHEASGTPAPRKRAVGRRRAAGMTWRRVAEIACGFPGIALYPPGVPDAVHCRLGKKLFVYMSREPGAIAIHPVYEDEQRFLMETEAATFFLSDHYRGANCILARLATADPAHVRELLETSWRRLALKGAVREYDAARARRAPARRARRGTGE